MREAMLGMLSPRIPAASRGPARLEPAARPARRALLRPRGVAAPSVLGALVGAVGRFRREAKAARRAEAAGPDAYYEELFPPVEKLEKWVDGEKYILVKYSNVPTWVPETEVGKYRFTQRGYESRDEDGSWTNYAQMPEDTRVGPNFFNQPLVLLKGKPKKGGSNSHTPTHTCNFTHVYTGRSLQPRRTRLT